MACDATRRDGYLRKMFSAFWLDLKKFIEMAQRCLAEGYQTMKRGGGEEGGGEKKLCEVSREKKKLRRNHKRNLERRGLNYRWG